ncbi:MAG: uncharacterized protein KVP18_000167 [Porospora cf. gigantea A]|uniref:uncharacterized protein n=1 Tax=Porospora cf. gigantea A TaxID=2853593 RepID=UPI00355957E9|nr:MAG: hypothetical protein KVP18_000167 [Porospora cf. gigantea A]
MSISPRLETPKDDNSDSNHQPSDEEAKSSRPRRVTLEEKYRTRGMSRSVQRNLEGLKESSQAKYEALVNGIGHRHHPITFGQKELVEFDEYLFDHSPIQHACSFYRVASWKLPKAKTVKVRRK